VNDLWLFLIGVLVTIPTLTAVILIGRFEGQDPALNGSSRSDD
jgi:hypothetical protein